MKLSEKELKNIIREEISRLLEQDPLAGPTAFAGQAKAPKDPLAGPTAFAGQAKPPKDDLASGPTAFTPEKPQAPQVPAQTLVAVKKQLAQLSAEIDKILSSLK